MAKGFWFNWCGVRLGHQYCAYNPGMMGIKPGLRNREADREKMLGTDPASSQASSPLVLPPSLPLWLLFSGLACDGAAYRTPPWPLRVFPCTFPNLEKSISDPQCPWGHLPPDVSKPLSWPFGLLPVCHSGYFDDLFLRMEAILSLEFLLVPIRSAEKIL